MAATYNTLVDDLGQIRAEIAALNKRKDDIQNALIATGAPALFGDLFDAAISRGVYREVLDASRVKEILSAAQYQRCLKVTRPTTIVRVSARKAIAA